MTTPDDGRNEAPPGGHHPEAGARDFRASASRTARQLTPEGAAAILQKVQRSFQGAVAVAGPGAVGGGGPSGSDYQFGGNYIVLRDAKRAADPRVTRVRTGLTDLDYSEVVSQGSSAGDSVLRAAERQPDAVRSRRVQELDAAT